MYAIKFGVFMVFWGKASACTYLTASPYTKVLYIPPDNNWDPINDPSPYECWNIKANNYYDIIELKSNFSTKHNSGCYSDYLAVNDTSSGSSVRKCGPNQSLTFYSTSDSLVVAYQALHGLADDGFRFEYKSTSRDNLNNDDWMHFDTTTKDSWPWWNNATKYPSSSRDWWNDWTPIPTAQIAHASDGGISHTSYQSSSSTNTGTILGITFGGISFLTIIILVTVVLLVVFVVKPRQGRNTGATTQTPTGRVSYINMSNPNQSSVMMQPVAMHNQPGNQQYPYIMQPGQQQLQQHIQSTPMMNPTYAPSSVVTNPMTSNQQQPQIQQSTVPSSVVTNPMTSNQQQPQIQQPPFNAVVNQHYQPQIQQQQPPFNAAVNQQHPAQFQPLPMFHATTNQQPPQIQQQHPPFNGSVNQQHQPQFQPQQIFNATTDQPQIQQPQINTTANQVSQGVEPTLIQFENPGENGTCDRFGASAGSGSGESGAGSGSGATIGSTRSGFAAGDGFSNSNQSNNTNDE